MNKKILKIASAISALNLTTPIVANATYKITTLTSQRTNINTTNGTPASILSKLRTSRNLGKTIILSSSYSPEKRIFYPKLTNNNRFNLRYNSININPN